VTKTVEVIHKIHKFLARKSKRKNLVYGGADSGKSLIRGTRVVMFSGELKKAEDIRKGDLLMGPDSKPRKVLAIGRGTADLFTVKQKYGKEYTVSDAHILSLIKVSYEHPHRTKHTTINVKEFYNRSGEKKQYEFKGWRTGVDFPTRPVRLDAYMLGLWLGDGNAACFEIGNEDVEVKQAIRKFARVEGLQIHRKYMEPKKAVPAYNVYRSKAKLVGRKSPLLNTMRSYNLLRNKHIPDDYLYNSRRVRLAVLAGLIDTDGHKNPECNSYSITQKRKGLAKQIQYLCHSLGFFCKMKKVHKGIKEIGFEGVYYSLRVYGDLRDCPIRIERKKMTSAPTRDYTRTRIEVEPAGRGEYFGFTVDKDHLFLLEDFTVTHNSWAVGQFLLLEKFYSERNIRILVVRKTLPSLRTSAYQLMLDLLREYDLPYELNKSTMTISNGSNTILFRPLDDIEKLKSIEGINYAWCEEATEITKKDFDQLNLRVRGVNPHGPNRLYFTFNPIDWHSFLRPMTEESDEDTAVCHTTVEDNPFVSEDYRRQLDTLDDPTTYKIYRKGEWTVLGNLVYEADSWDEVDEWPLAFEQCCYALDFSGFGKSRTALLELGLIGIDLFVRQLLYVLGWTNADLRAWMKESGEVDPDKEIVADSARPDLIEEIRQDGFAIIPSKKGPGSIRTGIDRVKRLKAHGYKSPGWAKEKKSWKWKEDKNGDPIGIPVDYQNDCMDAERYGVTYMLEGEIDISGYGSASHMAAKHQQEVAEDADDVQRAIDSLSTVKEDERVFICQGLIRNPTSAVVQKLEENLEHEDRYIARMCDDMLETIRVRELAKKAREGTK
jgi:PBSX family phage terminase large subunit